MKGGEGDPCRLVKNRYVINPSEEVAFKGIEGGWQTSVESVFAAVHERPVFHALVVIPGFVAPGTVICIHVCNTHSMAEFMTENTDADYLFFAVEIILIDFRGKGNFVAHAGSVNLHAVNGAERTAGVLNFRPYSTLITPGSTIAGIHDIYEIDISVSVLIVFREIDIILCCLTGILDECCFSRGVIGCRIVDLKSSVNIKLRMELTTAAMVEIFGHRALALCHYAVFPHVCSHL